MNKDLFLGLVYEQAYDEVQSALQNGFDPNTQYDDEGRTAVEYASYSDDYKMIEILWKAGAKYTIPFVEEIFFDFKNGKTHLDFLKPAENIQDYPDLTDSFSISQLNFELGCIESRENEFYISIPISKFVLDNEIIKTAITLDRIVLSQNIQQLIGTIIHFNINPEEGYIDGSVYLRSAHNPVDVSEINFISIENKILTIEIVMEFVFEFENIGFANEKAKSVFELTIIE